MSEAETPLVFPVGTVLNGTYEILRLLGEGGMGQVYEATDLDLTRKVAVKAQGPVAGLATIRDEARALAQIRHPGLVKVYAFGIHDDVQYVVMERLFGVSLDRYLRKQSSPKLPFAEVMRLMAGVAQALAAVHEAGIVHADVKPGNVFLTADQRIVLLDLGLFLAEVHAGHRTTIAGSPSYIAPEQITLTMERGAAHLVDLYALGAMGYEMLTGVVPFRAPSVSDQLRMHVYDAAPGVTSLRPDTPPALASLVRDLLAKDPLDRPQSAEAVAWQLAGLAAEVAPKTPPRGFDVLVVDDDPDIARVIEFYVKKAMPDATLRRASDGVSAIEALRQKPADLMLLDLQMPRMNGIEVCMLIRGGGIADDCAIVCVSAGAQASDVALLRTMGVTRYVPKGEGLGPAVASAVNDIAARRRR